HRRRPGDASQAAISVPLLYARQRPLRAPVPHESRPASADRCRADLPAAEDPQGQRQPAACSRPGAGMSDLSARFAPAPRTVPAISQREGARFGHRALSTAGDTTWSFAQACDVAARRAGALKALGIGPGDRVAIVCANRAELMELFLGCAWLGAVAVPLNT